MASGTIAVEVHGLIAQNFQKEYLEAVIADALQILPAYKDRKDTLVVINPRRIAVILDKQALQGAVVPAEPIEQILEGPAKARLQAWLASPEIPFYVLHIAGSWFSSEEAK